MCIHIWTVIREKDNARKIQKKILNLHTASLCMPTVITGNRKCCFCVNYEQPASKTALEWTLDEKSHTRYF